jgi:predicted glutamine amidotransferase
MDLGELNAQGDRMVIVATEPLTQGEDWQTLNTGDTQVFAGGELVWAHHCPRTRRFAVAGEAAREALV